MQQPLQGVAHKEGNEGPLQAHSQIFSVGKQQWFQH